MENRLVDWKDIASSYYDKCLALTILLILFTFMVFPNVETRSIKVQAKEIQSIDILNEIEQKIEQPQEAARPIVNIEIIDSDDSENSDDIEVIDTIQDTKIKYDVVLASPTNEEGKTLKFTVYDDPPVVVKPVTPKYSDFAKKMKIQGRVVLDVEILTSGNVGAVEVVKSLNPGPGGLDEAAITAIKQTKFQPATSNGKPVAVWLQIPVEFSLTK